ncbi:MAG: DUF4286 family protein [Chitinophagaceae bacterium]
MIIYNVTINVDWSIHEEWLQWVKQDQIPGMLATGHFSGSRILRLLQVDELEGPTYAVQYYADTIDDYNLFIESRSAIQSEKEFSKWGDKTVGFSTIMEVVQ